MKRAQLEDPEVSQSLPPLLKGPQRDGHRLPTGLNRFPHLTC